MRRASTEFIEVEHFRADASSAHFSCSPVVDEAAVAGVQAIDAAGDHQWFHDHPGAVTRMRPASPREIAAYGLSSGAQVEIERMGPGQDDLVAYIYSEGRSTKKQNKRKPK